MAITLKRQLSESDKQAILQTHGRKCWATGHDIPDSEKLHFDHIRAYSNDGSTSLDNIAPMCEIHNKQKGTLPLEDFRVRLRMNDFFQQSQDLTLGHLLQHMKDSRDITDYGQSIIVNEQNGGVQLVSATGSEECRLYACPATGWKYFYATLPVDLLDSDDDKDDVIGLQPRYLIPERVFELYRHFQRHPVLQPSIGRIVDGRIKVFDGQHKLAGLLWGGRRKFECKIYVTHDVRLLNQTNISAHDKFAQARFFSSIMVLKLGAQFGKDFLEYKNLEDAEIKTELRFIRWLGNRDALTSTKADRMSQFRSYLYNAVLDESENNLTPLVSKGNRSTDETPLTIDLLAKSLFSCFLYREPVDDNMTTDAYKRQSEKDNMIALMNDLFDFALVGWDPKAVASDPSKRKLRRLFGSKPMMAWSEILRDAICGKLNLQDADDRETVFYRELDDTQRSMIRGVVERLCQWKWWNAPANEEIDKVLAYSKSALKQWLKEKGLTTGYLMGAPE